MTELLSQIQKLYDDLLTTKSNLYNSPVYKLKRIIDHKLIELRWINHSHQEKQKRRKRTIEILTGGGKEVDKYKYEIEVIGLYDILFDIKNELEKGKALFNNLNYKSLLALVQMEMEAIDQNQRMININHIDLDLFDYLINEILVVKNESNLKGLLIKLNKVHKLKNK